MSNRMSRREAKKNKRSLFGIEVGAKLKDEDGLTAEPSEELEVPAAEEVSPAPDEAVATEDETDTVTSEAPAEDAWDAPVTAAIAAVDAPFARAAEPAVSADDYTAAADDTDTDDEPVIVAALPSVAEFFSTDSWSNLAAAGNEDVADAETETSQPVAEEPAPASELFVNDVDLDAELRRRLAAFMAEQDEKNAEAEAGKSAAADEAPADADVPWRNRFDSRIAAAGEGDEAGEPVEADTAEAATDNTSPINAEFEYTSLTLEGDEPADVQDDETPGEPATVEEPAAALPSIVPSSYRQAPSPEDLATFEDAVLRVHTAEINYQYVVYSADNEMVLATYDPAEVMAYFEGLGDIADDDQPVVHVRTIRADYWRALDWKTESENLPTA